MFDSLSILYLDTQNSFRRYGVQFAVEIKDLRMETSENVPSGGKRLVEAMKHYCGGGERLKPLSRDEEEEGIKVFAAVQRLRSSNATGLKERKDSELTHHRNLFLSFD